MGILLDESGADRARAASTGGLRSLRDSLAADLDAVIARAPAVAAEKARLTRAGGRCPVDATLLDFDPFSPDLHRCPRCGATYTGDEHRGFWLYWYQLWLAERAVHGAALALVTGEQRFAAFAGRVLLDVADRYLTYPNRDNVLGPSRPFFSTYLESIWLLQLVIALDLLEQSGDAGDLGSRVRERVVEPSVTLIASYDEGMSNRQVWNNAALMAAWALLGDRDGVERIVGAGSGLVAHMRHGLFSDGTWYEGENYHLFAHRGLWYGVTIAERAGIGLPGEEMRRFREAFATPFLTALPDLTLPARRDSQYRISLRQWRFAELCELGYARSDDPRLVGELSRLYESSIPRGDTGRASSSAEAERNSPPTGLTRADLGWRSLLFAREMLPPGDASRPQSVLLPGQGIAVLRRRRGEVYVALDYGASGGGHGHPDRLNVLLADGARRWLDDMGTGSYVDPTLHWYRSTLAHNAPMVDGEPQPRVDGVLRAYDEQGEVGWVAADAAIGPGVVARRTLVVTPDYTVDELAWMAPNEIRLDLPLHVDLHPDGELAFKSVDLPAERAATDGMRFVGAAARTRVGGRTALRLRSEDGRLIAWVWTDDAGELWRCTAPGPPDDGVRTFVMIRRFAERGAIRVLWDWSGTTRAVEWVGMGRGLRVRRDDGSVDVHERTDGGWVVQRASAPAIILRMATPGPEPEAQSYEEAAAEEGAAETEAIVVSSSHPFRATLGEAHYRQSEESWQEAGRPEAEVTIQAQNRGLEITIDVRRVARTFVAPGMTNPLDNERAEINGAGVQLYAATTDGSLGTLLVPDAQSPSVHVIPIDGWNAIAAFTVSARWESTDDGFRLTAHLSARTGEPIPDVLWLDLIVNEKPEGRERRRGQLVLSGADGERIYLRGDRHDPSRLLPFAVVGGAI
jgi:hypothetical protein